MRKTFFVLLGLLASLAINLPIAGQGIRAAEPFKLGTFANNGQQFIGIVVRDRFIVELDAANRDLESHPDVMKVAMPADMRDLITRYQSGMQRRLYEIVNAIVADKRLEAQSLPGYVHQAGTVRTLAPIMYPSKMLNSAGNYYKPGEERQADRGVPYLFIQPTAGAIVGDGEDILLPRGRNQIDAGTEVGIVIGRTTKYVKSGATNPYIFGYTVTLDITDRGPRPSPSKFNSDWLQGKAHDTFAPMGPWIIPREFVRDVFNLSQKLWINDKLVQDGSSNDMIHTINELVGAADEVMTLFPGDVIAAGSPVSSEQIFLKPGDRIRATIDGIGTLNHTVKADKGGE
jgi:2-keto-4-pentenoate hydratase/2-oxohepta-3-ene-1,7-dioic acid hydratase in catechol pathway